MTNETGGGQASQEQQSPHPDLQTLNRLVGTWSVSGEAEGTVTYEWTEGGHFHLQHVELGGSRGLEVIGHLRPYGGSTERGHQVR